MLRAFLSHSSQDKAFVRQVAARLGRAKIVFDEVTFAAGEDFRIAIQKGLDGSRLFVFFASRASLDSVWCRHELDEANWREIHKKLDGHLVFIIDRNVGLSDLPAWMKRCKVLINTRPTQAAREVEEMLFSIAPEEIKKPFLGRQREVQEATRALSDLRSQPRLLVVSGLEGIGRRTVLSRICRDLLSQSLGPFFFWDATKDTADLYLWLLSETSPLLSRADLAKEMAAYKALSEPKQIEELANRLGLICQDGAIPALVDEGGMLEENAALKPAVANLITTTLRINPLYTLALLHRRNANIDGGLASHTLRLRVPPLSDSDTGLLLQQLLRQMGVRAAPEAIDEIAPYLGGYPPSAYYCATFCREYGVENLRAEKSSLVDFKAKRFSKFIGELDLEDDEWRVLRYLAAEQPISLDGLAIACDLPLEKTALAVRKLVDLSLANVLDERIAVAAPIKDAIHRAKGFLDPDFYSDVVKRLTGAFWEDGGAAPSVEVIDATLNAVARGGLKDFGPYQDLVQVSTVHRLALESYHRKDFVSSLQYAKRALAMAPNRKEVRSTLFRALVQLEQWQQAERELKLIEDAGDKQQFYLRGFLERRRRRPQDAIKAFDAALKSGDTALPVYRDYGDCLFRLGRYDEAVDMIQKALAKDSENVFILDLIVRVLTEKRDFSSAEHFLKELARFDLDRRFVHHRQSILYAAKGNWEAALSEAENACGVGHAPFEAFAQRVDGLIETKQYDSAWREFHSLENRFKGQRIDVQHGLRCKLLTREGKWREALAAWNRLSEKNRPIHQSLYRRILELKAQDPSVSLTDRQQAENELAALTLGAEDRQLALELDEGSEE